MAGIKCFLINDFNYTCPSNNVQNITHTIKMVSMLWMYV